MDATIKPLKQDLLHSKPRGSSIARRGGASRAYIIGMGWRRRNPRRLARNPETGGQGL